MLDNLASALRRSPNPLPGWGQVGVWQKLVQLHPVLSAVQ